MPDVKHTQTKQLGPGSDSMGLLEAVSLSYDATIPVGMTPDDIMAPAFWAHHSVRLRPLDEIRARAEDGSWVCYLIVLDSSRTWTKVQRRQLLQLSTADVSQSQAVEEAVAAFIALHKVIHRGKARWSVVRIADSAVQDQGKVTREESVAWLEAFAKTQQVPAEVSEPETA